MADVILIPEVAPQTSLPAKVRTRPAFDWVVRKSSTSFSAKFLMLPENFPILLDDKTGFVCEPVFLWLYESYVELKSVNNWYGVTYAYSDDLKEWFRFLEEIELPWTQANSADLESFCSAMLAVPSPYTGEKYKTTTINRRRTAISEFYKWIRVQEPYRSEKFSTSSLLNPLCKTSKIYAGEVDEKNHVSVILPHQLKNLMSSLGRGPLELEKLFRDYFNSSSTLKVMESSSIRLFVEIALYTGLRLFEINSLSVRHFDSYEDSNLQDTKLYPVSGIRRKGGARRSVDFPGVLIKKIIIYIRSERSYILDKTKSSLSFLFLHPLSAGSRWAGKRISNRKVEREFHDACLRCGLSKSVRVFYKDDARDKEFSVRKSIVPMFVFHDLRHSYAVWTYYSRKKTEVSPWLYIQKQLGHKNLSTTIDIYLDALRFFESVVTDQYMEYLRHGKKEYIKV